MRAVGRWHDSHAVTVNVNAVFAAGHSPLGTAGPPDLNDAGRIDCSAPLHAGNLGPMSGSARCGTFDPNLGLDYATGRPGRLEQTVFSLP